MDSQKQDMRKQVWMVVLIVFAILVIDQVLKIWVKTNMTLHESIDIASWFKITFIENNGMAFGMEIGSKIFLSVFDCMFYGLCFNASTSVRAAEVVSFGHGYAPFLMGRVVDMFYFPLIETTWPDWMPVVGGQDFVFFSPIFNFADANVSVGVIALFIFYRKELSHISFRKQQEEDTPSDVEEQN